MSDMQERALLRQLAGRLREIADLDEMGQRRQRWVDHNGLRPQRPLVVVFPEGAWRELLPDDQLQCEDPTRRRWEGALRRRLYWWDHIRDDQAIEPVFRVGWHLDVGDLGVAIPHIRGENLGSYIWDPPLKDLRADMSKLRYRTLTVDRDASFAEVEAAERTFGDLLPVELTGKPWWTMGLTWWAAMFIGLEGLMMAMYDDPEALHALMAWLRDEHLNFITTAEQLGILDVQATDDYVGSGGLAYTDELPRPDHEPGAPARLGDLWGFAESQETVGISPEMFSEFVLPYQVPILERFGLNCYGCCEPVHHRLRAILDGVPRLRRISGSPWVDQAAMKEMIGDDYIFSRKPNPTQICSMFHEDRIRADLRQTLSIAGDGPLEIIMKDTHTVDGEPWRVGRWVEIALEEVDRHVNAGAAA